MILLLICFIHNIVQNFMEIIIKMIIEEKRYPVHDVGLPSSNKSNFPKQLANLYGDTYIDWFSCN